MQPTLRPSRLGWGEVGHLFWASQPCRRVLPLPFVREKLGPFVLGFWRLGKGFHVIQWIHCWGVYLLVQEKVSQCKHESNDMGKMSLMWFLKGKKPARKVGMYMCGKKINLDVVMTLMMGIKTFSLDGRIMGNVWCILCAFLCFLKLSKLSLYYFLKLRKSV